MRRLLAVLAACLPLLVAGPAQAANPSATKRSLARSMASAGSAAGAYVVDLDTGRTVYAKRAGTDRIPASNQKLYTTAAAMLSLGAYQRPDTVALVADEVDEDGVVRGHLYLRGNGDPTLSGADLRTLAAQLARAGITEITGRVVGDESVFDRLRGVGATNYGPNVDLAPVGALMVDRGRTGYANPYYQRKPAAFAASALAAALRARGVDVKKAGGQRRAPEDAIQVGAVQAPSFGSLSAYANVPSDNTIAETLLKAVGTDGFSRKGTTRRGATVAEDVLSETFRITPNIADGSGLSRYNKTSPRELVGLLAGIRETPVAGPFFDSLAVAGRSGTLSGRLRSSAARDRCRGKTGTLRDVSALSGYCTTAAGKTLAFSILMNRVNPSGARTLQDRMVDAIVRYTDV